ncbi:MAG: protein translocase subunit SecF, partial [Bacteroidales bacterium]|nr:protein translocase subunit SecF [Bacteroidales bacterium]
QEDVVGPSLGKEAINAGLISFIIAFALVLVYMVVYYSRAGWISNFALLTNMFFLLGVLASFGAVLTLPGIAGIVLTIGMAVDANVIIFERIKEEIRAGKGVKLAVHDGYKNALSAILDGNITTLLTGVVLYVFGSGPVQGFATTLIIGIVSSLFTAILISRLIFNWLLEKNVDVTFANKVTERWFTNVNIDFIGKRKTYYIVSAVVILLGVGSLLTKGLNQGVDFTGGRTYVVRFDEDVKTDEMRTALAEVFETAPEVKTFGPSKQVKITTKYLIEDNSIDADDRVEEALFNGVKGFYVNAITQKEFLSDDESKMNGILSSSKVGPTIADDLLHRSYMAIAFALFIIFVYIAARFRKWQFGVGGLVTLMHDALITIAMYSIFDGILPFSLEVDQAFIAAILTIIGYSINDTVIIFDRIREYIGLYPKRTMKENVNGAVNSTLGRTFMTSGTTLMVLLTIFILGGEVIRGFSFALIVGVLVGTYSSVFISTPVAYDLSKEEIKAPVVSKKKN